MTRQVLDTGERRHLRSPYCLHARYCRLRIAADGAIALACPHGRDVCPECDPCTCANPPRCGSRFRSGDEPVRSEPFPF